MNNIIPDITHPLGSGWTQPSRKNILIDDTHALMEEKTLKSLPEYSMSQPTGVYEGKMWSAKIRQKWYLCWFGKSSSPNMCSNNSRKIILV